MRTKIIAVVVCVLFLSVSFTLSPPSPVNASVGMTPTEGVVGTTVTISDLTAGKTYVIEWDDEDYKTGTVPTGGSVTFTIAETYGGEHDVVVESPVGTQVFSGTYTVLPSISIDTTTGYVGTSVGIEGLGFESAETKIKVYFDDAAVKTDRNSASCESPDAARCTSR